MLPPRSRVLRGKPKVFDVHDIRIDDVDEERVTIVIHGRRRSAGWPQIDRALRHPDQKPRLRALYLAINETGQALLQEKQQRETLLHQRACIVEVSPDTEAAGRWRVYLEGWVPEDFVVTEDDAESFGIYEDAALQAERTSRRLERMGVRVLRQYDLEEDLRRCWFPFESTPSLDTLGRAGPDSSGDGVYAPYAWIEYPLWAENDGGVRDALLDEAVCRREPGRADHLVRLVTYRRRGRFPRLEEALRDAGVPYDVGGGDGYGGLGWSGWWRPGYELPILFDVTATGETIVDLEEVRELQQLPASALHQAIRELIERHDPTPASELAAARPRLRLAG